MTDKEAAEEAELTRAIAAEHAEREEHPDREYLTDLAEHGTPSLLDQRHRGDPGSLDEPIQLRRPRTDRAVSDLLSTAHGFVVRGETKKRRKPAQCRYASPGDRHDVFDSAEWYCELRGEPDAVVDGGEIPEPVQRGSWEWANCECSWCSMRRLGFGDNRGEREVCFRPDCQRRAKADQVKRNRESQHKRQRQLAREFIDAYPGHTNRQIAALVDQTGLVGGPKCAAKRVREARESRSLPSCTPSEKCSA